MPDPKDLKGTSTQGPYPGVPAIQVGGRWMYPDSNGVLHPTPQGMISLNQSLEPDQSRGGSGGCGQDVSNMFPHTPLDSYTDSLKSKK